MKATGARRWVAPLTVLTLLALLALAGCSSDDPDAAEPTAGASAVDSEAAVDPEQAVRDECLSQVPPDAQIRPMTLEGATDGSLQALLFPSSGTRVALVLLPEVSGGVCGWGRFAAAAAGLGFSSVVVAPCLYGESTCSDAGDVDPLNEVAPAIEAARTELGAERVALVGTSMGGSLTVIAAAAGADADTWIDVSGPAAWEGTGLLGLAPDLPAGGLVVMARSDGDAAYASAQRLAKRSGARFLDGGSGHGYELLTDLDGKVSRVGRAVLAHAKG
ncbi:hypothetical protein [Nocardioides currus]|uniref:Alpha/beta hydrolase n=1 Tax=Nocardioides currus TaxID=2133958 RepID=A0A2R7YZ67_9ACTN|nr:hypothetical protein [Nocardioides currus]PUA81670.1 hypothetical protein C7S10_06250 [Nocardioides currus]